MKIAFFCATDFNLGAAYLIAHLKQIGHEVRLFLIHNLDGHPPLSQVKEYSPDLVCFSCVTANHKWALKTAYAIRKELDVRILFGGVHAILCPEDFKDFEVCTGDGLEYFGGKFKPDKLWPDREIFFEQLPKVHREYQIFMTGFGCPFRCSFCNNHQLHRKLIRRSASNCIEELMFLKQRGLKYVLFDDDVFTINLNWLREFLPYYQLHITLPFTCFGHAKYIDKEIVSMLKFARCQCIWLGIQSGSESTRKEILNRHETNEEILNAGKLIKDADIKLMIDHIFGLPFDTNRKISESYHFYRELKPDVVNCYELLYFPKAEINKYGHSEAMYQKQGGKDYQKYASTFTALPLTYN